MRIEYEVLPEDWAAFAEHRVRHAPSFRRAVRLWTVAGTTMLIMLGASLAAATKSWVWLMVGIGAGSAWMWSWPRQVITNARDHAIRQERPCLRGLHIMEATTEGLAASCDVTDALTRWPGIVGIESTDDHVFVMLGEAKGYTISKHRIIRGDMNEFLASIARHRA